MKFRHDINGLRAIAVIAVVLFHFNASWLPGGFAGVDVFFVISGFLMTGIIFRGLEQENFSIINFYVARAKRIIPALTVLCMVLMVFGWIYLVPKDYASLSKHIYSSIGFFSNHVYWEEAGYFDTASHEKWLLHTWSLSAEWQFYIIYPIVLVAMHKFMSLKAIKALVIVGTVLGFSFSVVATYYMPSASYYLLPTRAWEMMIGGIAYLYPLNIKEEGKKYLELFAISLIIGSYVFMSKENLWPGYLAIIPVLGSYLIIQSQRSTSRITGNNAFQLIGKWSYSIYLWHWPIVVGFSFFSFSQKYFILGIILSIILGFVSYMIVESSKYNGKKVFILYSMLLVVILCSVTIFNVDGAYFRFSKEKQVILKMVADAEDDWQGPPTNMFIEGYPISTIKGSGSKNILFVGGSHVQHTYPFVANNVGEYNVYYLTEGGCVPIKSEYERRQDCGNVYHYNHIFKDIKFDKIVTSSFLWVNSAKKGSIVWNNRLNEIDAMLDNFLSLAEEVYVIGPEPRGKEFSPDYAVKNGMQHYVLLSKVRERNNIIYDFSKELKNFNMVYFIDPILHLCDSTKCNTQSQEGFYYKDANHFRPWYAKEKLTYLDIILSATEGKYE